MPNTKMKKRKPDAFDFYVLFIVIVCVLGIGYLVAVWRSDLPLWMKFFLTSGGR